VRGGLDDALDKLARRDELRRRAAGESPGTPPAVTELVEAIAAVVSRYPELNVTVGVEGAGDPTLLHFALLDGVVQVSADHAVAARATEAAPKHADFEIEVEEDEPVVAEPPRGSHDDQDRFGPSDFEYSEPPTAERPFVSPAYASAPEPPVAPAHGYGYPAPEPAYSHQPGETSRDDLATRLRSTNGATAEQPGVDPARHAAHPFAATPPPPIPHPYAQTPPPPPPGYTEPPRQHSAPPFAQPYPEPAAPSFSTHHHPEPAAPSTAAHQASEPAPFPAQHAEPQPGFLEPQPGFPEPLAQPIPLQVERPEETEMAARRLAAMLRDDPTLLDNPPA
jgi:hypothetical protein